MQDAAGGEGETGYRYKVQVNVWLDGKEQQKKIITYVELKHDILHKSMYKWGQDIRTQEDPHKGHMMSTLTPPTRDMHAWKSHVYR